MWRRGAIGFFALRTLDAVFTKDGQWLIHDTENRARDQDDPVTGLVTDTRPNGRPRDRPEP